jgi:hypothetical protein
MHWHTTLWLVTSLLTLQNEVCFKCLFAQFNLTTPSYHKYNKQIGVFLNGVFSKFIE